MLTPTDYAWIRTFATPAMRRFRLLRERFDRTDGVDRRIRESVMKIENDLYELSVLTHYKSCNGGVSGANVPMIHEGYADDWRGEGI